MKIWRFIWIFNKDHLKSYKIQAKRKNRKIYFIFGKISIFPKIINYKNRIAKSRMVKNCCRMQKKWKNTTKQEWNSKLFFKRYVTRYTTRRHNEKFFTIAWTISEFSILNFFPHAFVVFMNVEKKENIVYKIFHFSYPPKALSGYAISWQIDGFIKRKIEDTKKTFRIRCHKQNNSNSSKPFLCLLFIYCCYIFLPFFSSLFILYFFILNLWHSQTRKMRKKVDFFISFKSVWAWRNKEWMSHSLTRKKNVTLTL